jgi:SAM-dependent methyltransferase
VARLPGGEEVPVGAGLTLVCPACRRFSERGLELFTVEPDGADFLKCAGCGQRWPVREGIPVFHRDADFSLPLFGDDAPSLALDQPESSPLPHALAQLSSYLNADVSQLLAKLRERPRVANSLELGCSVGLTLADGSVGLDRSAPALQAAAKLIDGGVDYWRRVSGRRYERTSLRREPLRNVRLVCADALDPPFVPGSFQRVAAFNLLDNVSSPRALLHHMHQLCEEGGEILLSTPYAWRDGIVAPEERLDGPEGLRSEVRSLGWTIEDDCDLRWSVPHDSRAETVYLVHYLRARR